MEPELAELSVDLSSATHRLLAVLPPVVHEDQWWDGSEEHFVRDLNESLRIFNEWHDRGCPPGDFERTLADMEAAETLELPPDLSPADLLAAQLLLVARTGADTWKIVLDVEIDSAIRQNAIDAAVAYLRARGWA